jgi:hypothetical protein
VVSVREISKAPQLAEVWWALFHDSKPEKLDMLYLAEFWIVTVDVESPKQLGSEPISLLIPAKLSRPQLEADGWTTPGSRFSLDLWRSDERDSLSQIMWQNIKGSEKLANQPRMRMPVSGTPAADAPVAPPPGIAGR